MKHSGRQRPNRRFDERDTMFARMARREDTPAYRHYYSKRPELKAVDDRMRKLPGLCRPGARYYDPEIAESADAYFGKIVALQPDPTLVAEWQKKLRRARRRTATVKEMIRELGAVAVGCTALEEEFVYSYKGRHDGDYGLRVGLDHSSALVFLVEMDFDEMQCAPEAETIRESARQYYRAARISVTAAAVLQACGFDACSHHDAHYEVILPPLAVRAGLGELGRNNILIADHYGSRVRIGAVTTSMPVRHDARVDLGADHFCEICRKCAENCPVHALSLNGKEEVRGVRKWPSDAERCHSYWRAVGTDCGICMAACPFSHPDNRFHNLVRWVVRKAPWTHRMALLCDDWIYGRKWSSGR